MNVHDYYKLSPLPALHKFPKFAPMTFHEAQQQLSTQLKTIYDAREAATITNWVMEHVTGLTKIDRLVQKTSHMPAEQLQQLQQYTAALLNHQPVQYVLQEAWFDGMKLFVNEHVLIPRPETEELVAWIVHDIQTTHPDFTGTMLDIGTGSGCIPVALKKRLPSATVIACDVSERALAVAKQNATTHLTPIAFIAVDFLNEQSRQQLPSCHILVSNPPYIPKKDMASMHQNVVAFEPHLALFVEDDDPFLFYNAIASFAQTHLLPGGMIYVEIHEELGNGVMEVFSAKGLTEVTIRKDMSGKDRMVRAKKNT